MMQSYRTGRERVSKRRFCGLAIVNIQRLHAVAERFQFGAVSLDSGANLCRRKPGHRRLGIVNYIWVQAN